MTRARPHVSCARYYSVLRGFGNYIIPNPNVAVADPAPEESHFTSRSLHEREYETP